MKNVKLNVDLRIVVIVLIVIVGVLIFLWKPWTDASTGRTIEAKGTAVIEAEPDEFQFSPMYQEKGADRTAIQKRLADKVSGVVAKLKELGVAENDIVLASNNYDNFYTEGSDEITSNSLTVTVKDKSQTQKIQDYLLTTSPQGQITPFPTFSDAKNKELKSQARIEAVKDAKKNAQATADELGAKLGKVVSVDDSSNDLNYPIAMSTKAEDLSVSGTTQITTASLPVLAGKQKISFNVSVKYEIK